MSEELKRSIIDIAVQEIIDDNLEQLLRSLYTNIEDDMPEERKHIHQLSNAIRGAVSLSMQLTVHLLEQIGIVQFPSDEAQLRRLLLEYTTKKSFSESD